MRWEPIGERIQQVRRKRNLTLRQFGAAIGISGQHLGLVEKGMRGLSAGTIVKICTAMDISADYLLFGTSDAAETASILDGLSHEQIGLTLEIAVKVAQFVTSDGGNEALIRELMRREQETLN